MKIPQHISQAAKIVVLATLLGTAWNFSLLRQVITSVAPSPPVRENSPLPLGLPQVKELFEKKTATFFDARVGEEYSIGHITGAQSLPLIDADTRIADLPKVVPLSRPLVIYCNGYGCPDSNLLAEKLLKAGYETVYVFLGGYPEWSAAGYPVEGVK